MWVLLTCVVVCTASASSPSSPVFVSSPCVVSSSTLPVSSPELITDSPEVNVAPNKRPLSQVNADDSCTFGSAFGGFVRWPSTTTLS